MNVQRIAKETKKFILNFRLKIEHINIDPCLDGSCNCSYLTIFDGPSSESPILYDKICGSSTKFVENLAFDSSGDTVSIQFVTDSFEFVDPTGDGFVIHYEIVPSPTFIALIVGSIVSTVLLGIVTVFGFTTLWARHKRKLMQERK